MRNEKLKELIDCCNLEQWNVHEINTYKIGDNVKVALIWEEPPKGESPRENSQRFFFILNESQCVGVIADMVSDLHAFVLEEHRRQGFFHKAFSEVILPYLLVDRKEQIVTTDFLGDYLLQQGFEKKEDNVYSIIANKLDEFNIFGVQQSKLTSNELKSINRNFYRIASELMILRDRLYCSSYMDFNLEKIANQIRNIHPDYYLP